VVDDGSADETASLVEQFATDHPGVQLLRLTHGGKGWAIKNGMLHAHGEYRFMADADLSMPVSQLSLFLMPDMAKWDISIGSREAAGAKRVNEPMRRHLMGRIYNYLIRLLLIPGIQDTQCGFKLFKDSVAQELFSLQRIKGWGFDIEVLFLARKRKLRVHEVPIEWHYRSQSKVRPVRDSLAMTFEILRVRWYSLSGAYRSPEP
jgi:dolichyl-phosphate beta-glucosyltransferase